MINRNNITGIILAGGKSSRMGTDKGLIKLDGATFIERIINTMKPFVKEIIIVSNNSDYDQFGFKRVEDMIKNSGPLAGLHTGLYYSESEYNMVLSCDVPMINSKVLNYLIEGIDETSDVFQLKSQDRTIPLVAIYKKQCLNRCTNLLKTGELRLRVFVEQLNTKTIVLDATMDNYVKNINTKEELKQLEYAVEH